MWIYFSETLLQENFFTLDLASQETIPIVHKFVENLSKPNGVTNKLTKGARGPTRGEPRSQSSRMTPHTPFIHFP